MESWCEQRMSRSEEAAVDVDDHGMLPGAQFLGNEHCGFDVMVCYGLVPSRCQ